MLRKQVIKFITFPLRIFSHEKVLNALRSKICSGRKNELSRIHELFDTHDHDRHIVAKAKNNNMRNSQIVVIEGDAGIGKTRLVEQVNS